MNSANEILESELKLSIDGFGDVASNKDSSSKGYGLVLDRSNNPNLCSIASVGYALSAFVIGVEKGFLKREDVLDRTKGTLKTLLTLENSHGFLPHFFSMDKAEMKKGAEYSTIDTALMLQGVITAESYFNDPEISRMAELLLQRIEGEGISFRTEDDRGLIHMSYNPDKDGDYVSDGDSGFIWHGSMPAEQLMMYFQAAANDNVSESFAKELYLGFQRTTLNYDGIQYVAPPRGAMFLHQFTHAGFNFSKFNDMYGFSGGDNAINATKVSIQFSKNNPFKFKGLNENAGGLSASDAPSGYKVGGLPPFHMGIEEKKNANLDGTIQPYSMIGCLSYSPKDVKRSILWTYKNHPQTGGKYGFYEAYNLEDQKPGYGNTYLGIDKGISTLMIDNYLNGTTGKYYMNSKYIKKAIEKLNFKRVENE